MISATEWFNNNAEVYDKKLSSPLAIAENKVLFEFLSEEIEDHHTVFDAGCGTGLLLDYIKIDPENYVGWDISEEMVRVAREKHPNHKFICKDILDPSEEGFDVVVSLFGVISLMEDMKEGFKACLNKSLEKTIVMVNAGRNPYSRQDSIYTLCNHNKIDVHTTNLQNWMDIVQDCGVERCAYLPFNIRADEFADKAHLNLDMDVYQHILNLEMRCIDQDWVDEEVGFYLTIVF